MRSSGNVSTPGGGIAPAGAGETVGPEARRSLNASGGAFSPALLLTRVIGMLGELECCEPGLPDYADRRGAYLAAVAMIRSLGLDVVFTDADRGCPGYDIAAALVLESETRTTTRSRRAL